MSQRLPNLYLEERKSQVSWAMHEDMTSLAIDRELLCHRWRCFDNGREFWLFAAAMDDIIPNFGNLARM